MTNSVRAGGAIPLSREVALAKWGHFADRHIRGNTHEEQIVALVRAGAIDATLKVFWQEIKNLSWPNTYGESPFQISPVSLTRIEHFLEAERTQLDANAPQTAAPARRFRP